MAKPINHDFASGTVTTAWSAAKGGLLGVVVSAVAIGLLTAGVAALAGTVGIALFAAAGTTASMFAGVGGAVTLGAGIVGALFGGASSTIPALIFGSVGALTGLHKVNAERSAFRNKAMQYAQSQQTTQGAAAMAGMQQGYAAGFQEGQEYVVNQLRQHMQEQMMSQALKAHGGHAAKVCKEREMQAAATPQVG